MKKIVFTIAFILSLGLNSKVWAEGNRANEVNGTNNTNNTTVRTIKTPRFNNKKLKQLFFLNDDFDEDVKKNKIFETITIYSGSNATSVASSFAHNFGEESSSFRGKRISGDDLFLNTALANNADDEVNKFLDWVLAQGTKYNHEFGLLNLK